MIFKNKDKVNALKYYSIIKKKIIHEYLINIYNFANNEQYLVKCIIKCVVKYIIKKKYHLEKKNYTIDYIKKILYNPLYYDKSDILYDIFNYVEIINPIFLITLINILNNNYLNE